MNFDIERVVAARARITADAVISRESIRDMETHVHLDHMLDSVFLKITAWFLECCHDEWKEPTHVPADWWQAFKERWFPDWALERWPVRNRTIYTVHKKSRVCPHIKTDRNQAHFNFLADWDHSKGHDQWKR